MVCMMIIGTPHRGMGIGSGEMGLTRVMSGAQGVLRLKTLSMIVGSSRLLRKLLTASSAVVSHIWVTLDTMQACILRNCSLSVSGNGPAPQMAS